MLAIREHGTQLGSRQKFEALEETIKADCSSHEYFLCDDTLSAFPGRGEDIMAKMGRVVS